MIFMIVGLFKKYIYIHIHRLQFFWLKLSGSSLSFVQTGLLNRSLLRSDRSTESARLEELHWTRHPRQYEPEKSMGENFQDLSIAVFVYVCAEKNLFSNINHQLMIL